MDNLPMDDCKRSLNDGWNHNEANWEVPLREPFGGRGWDPSGLSKIKSPSSRMHEFPMFGERKY